MARIPCLSHSPFLSSILLGVPAPFRFCAYPGRRMGLHGQNCVHEADLAELQTSPAMLILFLGCRWMQLHPDRGEDDLPHAGLLPSQIPGMLLPLPNPQPLNIPQVPGLFQPAQLQGLIQPGQFPRDFVHPQEPQGVVTRRRRSAYLMNPSLHDASCGMQDFQEDVTVRRAVKRARRLSPHEDTENIQPNGGALEKAM